MLLLAFLFLCLIARGFFVLPVSSFPCGLCVCVCCYFYIVFLVKLARSMEISLLNNGIFVDACYYYLAIHTFISSHSLSDPRLSEYVSHLQSRIESNFFSLFGQHKQPQSRKKNINKQTNTCIATLTSKQRFKLLFFFRLDSIGLCFQSTRSHRAGNFPHNISHQYRWL